MSVLPESKARADKYQGRINNLISQVEELQSLPEFSLDSLKVFDIIKKISVSPLLSTAFHRLF